MMLKYFSLIGFCLLMACGSTTPGDVLSKEKMQGVLWDVAQGGEFLNNFVYYKYPEQNRAALNNLMLQRIFKIHHITKKEFNKSLEYYRKNPEKLTVIIDSINARQTRQQRSDTSHPFIPAPPGGATDKPFMITPTPRNIQ